MSFLVEAKCLARIVEEAQTEYVVRKDKNDVCLPEKIEEQICDMHEDAEISFGQHCDAGG